MGGSEMSDDNLTEAEKEALAMFRIQISNLVAMVLRKHPGLTLNLFDTLREMGGGE